MKTITGSHWTLHVGDVVDGLARIPPKSVQVVVTSPPYLNQRDYGIPPRRWLDGDVCVYGSESTVEGYLRHTVEIFEWLGEVLRDDGLIWWNVGDKWENGLPLFVPQRVALTLAAAGWRVLKEVIWNKRSPMPESLFGWRWVRCTKSTGRRLMADHDVHLHKAEGIGRGKDVRPTKPEKVPCPGCKKCKAGGGYRLTRGSWRPTTAHESIFLIAKGPRYFADGDTSSEPVSGGAHHRGAGQNPKMGTRGDGVKANGEFAANVRDLVETRNQRDVWTLSTEGTKHKHFAGFPTEIPRRAISASVSKGGCCARCGTCFAPVVEQERVPTRPGTGSKVGTNGADVVGNRDPERHTTRKTVIGYRPACRCEQVLPPARPLVLDPFTGTGTTGQVAVNMGCDFVGCEISEAYAEIIPKRIATPWIPFPDRQKAKRERKKKAKQRRAAERLQRLLFGKAK